MQYTNQGDQHAGADDQPHTETADHPVTPADPQIRPDHQAIPADQNEMPDHNLAQSMGHDQVVLTAPATEHHSDHSLDHHPVSQGQTGSVASEAHDEHVIPASHMSPDYGGPHENEHQNAGHATEGGQTSQSTSAAQHHDREHHAEPNRGYDDRREDSDSERDRYHDHAYNQGHGDSHSHERDYGQETNYSHERDNRQERAPGYYVKNRDDRNRNEFSRDDANRDESNRSERNQDDLSVEFRHLNDDLSQMMTSLSSDLQHMQSDMQRRLDDQIDQAHRIHSELQQLMGNIQDQFRNG